MLRWSVALGVTLVLTTGLHAAGPARAPDKTPHPVAAHASKPAGSHAAPSPVAEALGRHLLDPAVPFREIQDYVDARIPPMPSVRTVAEWETYAQRVRRDVLDRVVFRGEAAKWRALATRVEWQETIDGGPRYKIKKLRYEAVPGLWIPALLYEPTGLKGQVPVSLAVNGHDGRGKAIPYKQIRCINQAKRGMIVLNTEFFGMGQLSGPSYGHDRMNQLELCGASGLAPFYLTMSRGLDILLAHEHADPTRVAVQGLSGGGWQTITISALDTRVTLCNPVAGYSSLHTRVRNVSDLGDSEQIPTDLETITDYVQMTGMLAPRPALLTYNIADDCCFKAESTLPLLKAAGRSIYELYGKPHNLGAYVNLIPGTHNYERDNREQFYGFLKNHFFADRPEVTAKEIPSESEVKTPDQLQVDLPKNNANFNSLARGLLSSLPREPNVPTTRDEAIRWQSERRSELKDLLRTHDWNVEQVTIASRMIGPVSERDRWLRFGQEWTLPCVEFTPPNPTGDAVVVSDQGRVAAAGAVEALLRSSRRVIVVDLYNFGESRHNQSPDQLALAVSSVGERPLGIQVGQLVAIARWDMKRNRTAPTLMGVGPRSSLIATAAAALEPDAVAGIELHGSFGSLKQVVEDNLTVSQFPELFCFGLLKRFDVRQLAALVVPRPIHFFEPSERVKSELAALNKVYATFGANIDPIR